ncbi:hypothetical protein [Shimia biformata]|uniref:hypothetical protein n=1 Tax=Shimia biformata TaxID=1294299 RepID=UPI0019500514|nr:hypothetical protein [Shimia biformata]
MARQKAIFVERRSYRRRRMIDGLRLLPFVGLFLWFVPLLWTDAGPDGVSTADAIIFIFGIWVSLVAATAFLTRRALGEDDNPPTGDL